MYLYQTITVLNTYGLAIVDYSRDRTTASSRKTNRNTINYRNQRDRNESNRINS